MNIAVASGKGGTGKTTVSTNLAYMAACDGQSVTYIDCDVDEPNGHLFLKPELTERRAVERMAPQVDADSCTLCGACAEVCAFSAIACVGKKALVFTELCHSCGGCALACPENAITEVPRPVGLLETGKADRIHVIQGSLNIGEAMSPPVIAAVKAAAPGNGLQIIDAPPGTSCPVIESLRGVDYVVLVTEPTPFGLHDLKLAVEMVRVLNRPFGVVINRADVGDEAVRNFCHSQEIEVLVEIPDERSIAEAYSQGQLLCQALPEYTSVFTTLLRNIIHHA